MFFSLIRFVISFLFILIFSLFLTMMYLLLVLIAAEFVPIIIAFEYFPQTVNKYTSKKLSKCSMYALLFILGLLLYPLWFMLAIVPGICLNRSKIYECILLLIYDKDRYEWLQLSNCTFHYKTLNEFCLSPHFFFWSFITKTIFLFLTEGNEKTNSCLISISLFICDLIPVMCVLLS